TGLYMFRGFPDLYGANESVRYMYRANHVYVLLSSLINVAFGIYLVPLQTGWKARLGRIGSALLILSPLLLCYAFFAEAPKSPPERVFTGLGVFALLLGVLAHLPSSGAKATALRRASHARRCRAGARRRCELVRLQNDVTENGSQAPRAAFPVMNSAQLEFVQPRRIIDENFLAHRSVRRPGGQEIEHKPVVDLP